MKYPIRNSTTNQPNEVMQSLQAKYKERLAALEAVSRLLVSSQFDLTRLLKEIVRIAAEHMQAQACMIQLVDAKTGALVLEAAHGLSQAFIASAPSFTPKGSLWDLIKGGEPVEILDIDTENGIYPAEVGLREGVRSMLVGGIFKKGSLLGTLSIFTEEEHAFTELEQHTLRILAGHAALAIELAQLHEKQLENQQLRQELVLAAEVQARMLPDTVPEVPGAQIAAWGQPWREVGGDFYDFLALPGSGLGLCIGDVAGKGLPAALIMMAVRSALRSQAENLYWLPEVIRRVNRTLYHSSQPEQFSTLFYGIFNPFSRKLNYINAGHNPPLLIRGSETIRLEASGVPVGLLPDSTYEIATIQLETEDLLVLYTDGFTDVICEGDRVFGEKRLCKTLHAHHDASPEAIIEIINETLKEARCGGDDRAIVVIKLD